MAAAPYTVSERLANRLENDFVYHAPFGDQAERYGDIRHEAKEFAYFLAARAPESRELSMALSALDDVVFFTNAAIARNEVDTSATISLTLAGEGVAGGLANVAYFICVCGHKEESHAWAPILGKRTDCLVSGCKCDAYVYKFEPAEKAEVVRQFETGANRDVADDKHEYAGFLSPLVLQSFARYMHKNRHLRDGSMRASDNWQKGIPRDVYEQSLIRHVMDFWALHRGFPGEQTQDMEEALNGILFNAMGYLFETLKDGGK